MMTGGPSPYRSNAIIVPSADTAVFIGWSSLLARRRAGIGVGQLLTYRCTPLRPAAGRRDRVRFRGSQGRPDAGSAGHACVFGGGVPSGVVAVFGERAATGDQ